MTRSATPMRWKARADSRPRKASNGEIFDSYACRYRSIGFEPEFEFDGCKVEDGFGFAP